MPFNGGEIPILSAEDIVIFKALFGRGQDWLDIQNIFEVNGRHLDMNYMTGWLGNLVGSDDERIAQINRLANQFGQEPS